MTEFDGSLLKSAEQLNALRTLHLDTRSRPSELTALSRIPELRSLTVAFGSLAPEDWSFIAGMGSLEELDILRAFCDDSIVSWIRQNTKLRSVSVYETCLLTDAGVYELANCTQLEKLTISGFITPKAIEGLRQLPRLTYLIVRSKLVDEVARRELVDSFAYLDRFHLDTINTGFGEIALSDDGYYRQVPKKGRQLLDGLEGISLQSMLGSSASDEVMQHLEGRVVLVEFWGTWCGPCLAFTPELKRLHAKFAGQGLEVVRVHSQTQAESAEEYLMANPTGFHELIDHDGSLEEAFAVPSFPACYLFDSDGKLRLAFPFRFGLDRPLSQLVAEIQ